MISLYTEYLYFTGVLPPHHPMPAIVPATLKAALDMYCAVENTGGINWSWAYFICQSNAEAFDVWCIEHGLTTRGVYLPYLRDCRYGVRYR